jgi:alpha-glucosidase
MRGVIRFWLERGADGYRVDAIDRLLKDPDLRDDPPAREPFGLPLGQEQAALALTNSRNAPDTGRALAAIREAAGDALLVGEVYLPSAKWQPYLEHLDLAFAFELLHARWDAEELRLAVEAAASVTGARGSAVSWVLSNHDFGRLATRFGPENAGAAALLLLTLPGVAFLYQGDEIGLEDGPGAEPAFDRAGRDRHRHPMQWDGSPTGGFTSGEPWLAPVDPERRNVEDQLRDPSSMLALCRRLVDLRRRLHGPLQMLEPADGVLAYERGDHLVAINTASGERPAPGGELLLETRPEALHDGELTPHAGVLLARV